VARTFVGRSSEELYNSELYKLFEVMQHIIDEPDDPNLGPLTSRNGSLWLDRSVGGDLKFKADGTWKTVFNDKFRMICEILSPEEPSVPVSGQLWLNDGILMYFSGAEWLPVKSVNVATEFNLSAFEQFLIISPIKAAGKLVVDQNGAIHTPKQIVEHTVHVEEIIATENQRTFTLSKPFVKGQNHVTPYIYGRKIPPSAYTELSNKTIVFEKGIPAGSVVEFYVLNVSSIQNPYKEEVFKVTDPVITYTLQSGKYYLNTNSISVYVDGRKLPRSFYKEVDESNVKIIKTDDLETSSAKKHTVTIEYVNKEAYDKQETSDANGLVPSETNTQFLLPSVELDRFFINGMHTHDYTEVSDVAIEYPTAGLQGKFASAIHVNPKKLTNIKKRLFKINPSNPIIPVTETNTEFYGIEGGIGKLLLKAKDCAEYTSVPIGIRLSEEAIKKYDFIETITYEFKNVKGTGTMVKGKVHLSETTSIYVGDISDELCVFTQGLYLDDHKDNYVYEDGFIKLKMDSKMDVGVIAFPKKEIGTITSLNDKKEGIIHINKTYKRSLVFVYGENLDWSVADYTFDKTNKNIIYVKDAKVGMKFAVVETHADDPNEEMYVSSGIIKKDPDTQDTYINIPPGSISEQDNVILFVNGLLIMKKDVMVDTANNRIEVAGGLEEGLSYMLLKDSSGRFVFSDYVSFNTIPLNHFSDATLVYIGNQLATDGRAVYTSRLPERGYEGEIKQLLTNDSSDWYYYDSINGWIMITEESEIDLLNATASSYISDEYSINILQNFGKKECVYYSYQYANSVEQPLRRGVIKSLETKDEYRTAFNHVFPANRNALSVWQNGLRQYPDTTGDPENFNGVFEVGNSSFKMPNPIDGIIFYVVEKPEGNEAKSCERQVLTYKDVIEGTTNIFKTDISLYPGNVRVFVSGLRQPESAFKIIDNYRIMIKDEILAYPSNFPKETIKLDDGSLIEIEHKYPDSILIEVRQDYGLKEVTLPIRYAGQNEWSVAAKDSDDITKGGDGLPESIIDSKDLIMIYINGLAYGKDYKIDKDQQKIILTNETITSTFGVDPLEEFFRSNPDEYEAWRIQNGGKEYVAKEIKDTITFEWR